MSTKINKFKPLQNNEFNNTTVPINKASFKPKRSVGEPDFENVHHDGLYIMDPVFSPLIRFC